MAVADALLHPVPPDGHALPPQPLIHRVCGVHDARFVAAIVGKIGHKDTSIQGIDSEVGKLGISGEGNG